MTLLNRAFRDRWVARLLSGEETQGHGKLENLDGSRCCLGVACALDEGVVRQAYAAHVWFNGDFILPPRDVLARWGLDRDDTIDLTAMNDDQGKSFAEIAAYIMTLPVAD